MSTMRELLLAMDDATLEERLIATHMDGFCSGAASAVMTMLMNRPDPPSQEEAHAHADRLGQWLAHGMVQDRLGFEEVRNEILERLSGEDSGPKTYQVDAPRRPT